MAPLAQFRIHPDGGSRFVQVFIWKTLKQLQAVKLDGKVIGRGAEGFCLAHIWRPGESCPIVADVHFCKPYMGAGMVSHEMFHATRVWLARSRRPITYDHDWSREVALSGVSDNEEYGAGIIDQLCKQFFTFIYKHGLARHGEPC